MENKTLIQLLILALFLFSCKSTDKNLIHVDKYKSTSNNLLFRDSRGRLFLKKTNTDTKEKKELYYFIDEMLLIDNTIIKTDSILDKKTFVKCKGTNIYFIDKNRVYSHSDDAARWPVFIELNLNRDNFKIIDSLTIRDNSNQYHKGYKFNE